MKILIVCSLPSLRKVDAKVLSSLPGAVVDARCVVVVLCLGRPLSTVGRSQVRTRLDRARSHFEGRGRATHTLCVKCVLRQTQHAAHTTRSQDAKAQGARGPSNHTIPLARARSSFMWGRYHHSHNLRFGNSHEIDLQGTHKLSARKGSVPIMLKNFARLSMDFRT
jgi:hypothetical protein